MAAEVTMTLEEYHALMEAKHKSIVTDVRKKAKQKAKKSGKKDPKMARELKKANSMMRTKSGKLRKGATQAKIMKKAHQLRRKM